MKISLTFGFIFLCTSLFAQSKEDSLKLGQPSLQMDKPEWRTTYQIDEHTQVEYKLPKFKEIITKEPIDIWSFCKFPLRKQNFQYLALIAFSSAVLIENDQLIINETQRFFDRIHIDRRSHYKDVVAPKINGQKVSIISIPQNINTVFYTLGQGYPALMLGGGLLYYGVRNHDVRAVSTAHQLTESFVALGIVTQIIKRITGRQTPLHATQDGGQWNSFPSFSNYQENTPEYDAFPSGHLATVVCAVTILSENYPEKKWIKPIGYVLSSLVAVSMVNNGVHWVGDYPLAIGIGYGFGKVVSTRNRKINIKY